ncbi:MAG: hypothetical protein M9910_04385 [Kiritimatiellae bacterium]|nr:hypothetical protein [Kiritimatiellia bacterium]
MACFIGHAAACVKLHHTESPLAVPGGFRYGRAFSGQVAWIKTEDSMGLFDSIKSVFGGGAADSGRDTDRVYLVDAEKLADGREGRTGPVERFRAIQLLSRFAEREKISIVAIVGGRPLREVANGDEYNGVRVFYAEENNSVADQIEKTLGSLGKRTVVVTNDKQLETRLAERGIATLRVSTLRKAFENGNGDSGNGNGRGDRGGRSRDRRDRGDRGDRRRGGRPDRPRSQQAEGGAEDGDEDSSSDIETQSQPSPRPTDTVDGLIDRVD